MKKKTYIFIISLLFSAAAYPQQLAEGIVAVIGKEIVLKSEVDYYVRSYAVQNKINLARDQEKVNALKKQILDKMVEQKVLLTKADQDTIKVDEQEVEQRVEQHVNYLISQVGSEEKLEEVFQNPIKKIRRNLIKETEERMKIDMLRRTQFASVKVSRREVEKFYKSYKDSIPKYEETVEISHILKEVRAGEDSRNSALEQIRNIAQQIKNGADFKELARQYSQDPASAKRGGELGFTKRGDFVKEFEEVAFSLNENEISDIVESQFGFHIIQLIEKRGEKINTRHILIQVQPTDQDDKRAIEELTGLRQRIIDGESFSDLAVQYSDDENVQKDKGFLGKFETRNLSIPAFAKIIDLLEPGDISMPFKTEFGYHIVKLNSRTDAREMSLTSDWERIQEMALNFKIENEYSRWIIKLKEDIPIQINETIL